MEAFATLADYVERYGEVAASEQSFVEAKLTEASVRIARALGSSYERGADEGLDEAAKYVCMGMVWRSSALPAGLEGVSQVTETGGPFSKSYTYANPDGALYLSAADRKMLGLGTARFRTIEARCGYDESS